MYKKTQSEISRLSNISRLWHKFEGCIILSLLIKKEVGQKSLQQKFAIFQENRKLLLANTQIISVFGKNKRAKQNFNEAVCHIVKGIKF